MYVLNEQSKTTSFLVILGKKGVMYYYTEVHKCKGTFMIILNSDTLVAQRPPRTHGRCATNLCIRFDAGT